MAQSKIETNRGVFREPDNFSVKVWRYMDFTKFVSLLELRSLYFARSDLLGDPFEGTFRRNRIEQTKKDLAHAAIPPEGFLRLRDVREFSRIHHTSAYVKPRFRPACSGMRQAGSGREGSR